MSRAIHDKLLERDTSANFEDVLHALEELEAAQDATLGTRASSYLQPFISISNAVPALRDVNVLRHERSEIIALIAMACERTDYSCWQPLHAVLKPLLERYALDIFTLNYDLLADKAASELCFPQGTPMTGFPPITELSREPYSRFWPAHYVQDRHRSRVSLAHLHGSVRYGYAYDHTTQMGGRLFYVVECEDPKAAAENRRRIQGSAFNSAAGIFGAAAMVSGMRKSEKLNVRPYGYYFQAFAQALSTAPRLLVIGYGGRDPHINFWIHEFLSIHWTPRIVDITAERFSTDFLLEKVRTMRNNWIATGDDVFRNREEATNIALVLASGLTRSSIIPIDEIDKHFGGAQSEWRAT